MVSGHRTRGQRHWPINPNQGLPMKCSALLPQVALVLAVAYACSDSTSPAISNAVAAGNQRASTVGKQPPPPVSTVIAVTINSPGQAVFTGVFFNNGFIHADGPTATETSDGTAWLQFDNKQPNLGFLSGTASPNARFMVKGDDTACPVDPSTCPTGKGTLTIEGVVYTIVSVESFRRFSFCETGVEASPCAKIHFTVTDGVREHIADLFAFDKATCLVDDDGLNYECGFPPPVDSGEG